MERKEGDSLPKSKSTFKVTTASRSAFSVLESVLRNDPSI